MCSCVYPLYRHIGITVQYCRLDLANKQTYIHIQFNFSALQKWEHIYIFVKLPGHYVIIQRKVFHYCEVNKPDGFKINTKSVLSFCTQPHRSLNSIQTFSYLAEFRIIVLIDYGTQLCHSNCHSENKSNLIHNLEAAKSSPSMDFFWAVKPNPLWRKSFIVKRWSLNYLSKTARNIFGAAKVRPSVQRRLHQVSSKVMVAWHRGSAIQPLVLVHCAKWLEIRRQRNIDLSRL